MVLAAEGYPANYAKGKVITGLNSVENSANAKIFHAGTTEKDGQTVTAGGRVLCAVGLGDTVSAAQKHAYTLAKKIRWEGMFYRNDIGYRAIDRERKNN